MLAHKKIPLLNVTFFCLKAIVRVCPDELTTVYLHKFHLKSLSINNKLGVSSTLCMVQHLDKHVNQCNGITKKFNGPLSITTSINEKAYLNIFSFTDTNVTLLHAKNVKSCNKIML